MDESDFGAVERSSNVSTSNSSMLSIDVQSAAKGMNVPLTCMEGIWRKASELLQEKNGMFPAPGQSAEARMVLSFSGKVPHMVQPSKGGGFRCDSNCPNWKSISLCSHTVAVAEIN